MEPKKTPQGTHCKAVRAPSLPALILLPVLAGFCALAPAFASPALADRVNPAGNVIHTSSVGMGTLKPGDSLINLGGIEGSNPSASGITGIWLQNGGTALNAGFITLTGNGGNVYGILSDPSTSGTVGNSGSITVTNTGASTDKTIGIYLENGGTAHNSGTITARSVGPASGITIDIGGTADNRGAITVMSSSGNAYGMSLGSGTAANYGVIRVSAPTPGKEAHELEMNGAVRLAAWSLELRDFGTDATRPFAVTGSGSLDFNGSRLILRPGTTAQGFVWGQEYKVEDMVTSGSGSNVSGSVASVASELPDLLEARLTGTDWNDQKVSLRTTVKASSNPGQSAALQAVGNARSGMQHLSGVLAGQLAPRKAAGKDVILAGNSPNSRPEGMPSGDPLGPDETGRWRVFAAPYFSSAANHDQDYTSNNVGMVMGGTWRFNENFAGGLHLGYSGSHTWGDLMDTDNSAQSGLAGLHAVFNVTPEWYLRGQFTGFISRYHSNYQSGLAENPIYADNEFNGHGLYAALHTGYAWWINDNNTLTPEIGLAWLWSHQDENSLHWSDSAGVSRPAYDIKFDAQDYAALYGTAMLRWRGDFALGDERAGNLRPALGLGLRQTLTSGEVESQMRFAGSSFSTSVTEEHTTMLAEAGLEWQYGGFAVGLAYTGEYGAQQEVHTGWLTMKFEF
ncbi:hypothetical protein HMPREF1022_01420 [Desulfovibrio sp. 6_1_46AFAA]|uniref:autotransporter family protein n=1 Tax=Desulfovibrio sp. 6_1_46AFAA TaxID=665942 RepID=UPI0002237105|nr:autotransporter outer membrane beta-barrel domain-containing protein [Desulfovibrio sp. 6_1_46AFAA]EGW51619.1 hypothetical protein HMPREF1022_01420 [Desulfovibrio sp. 6_1_46AFAA]